MTSAYDTAATLLGYLDRQGDEGTAATVYALLAIADAIRDASPVTGRVQDVHDLHWKDYNAEGDEVCHRCWETYPCKTIRALDGRSP